MPNLAAMLKEEIRRLAKKEVKAQTESTKQAVIQYRREIASLKRQLREQEKKIAFLESQEQKRLGQPGAAEEPAEDVRFSSRSVRAQRKRLRLSAKDYGKLVGVSALTIYNWENGKSRPQKAQLASLVAVRGIGKREALARLKLLKAEEEKAAGSTGKQKRKRSKRKAKS
jgi:DNA-binding transcriptional regulator YiaG